MILVLGETPKTTPFPLLKHHLQRAGVNLDEVEWDYVVPHNTLTNGKARMPNSRELAAALEHRSKLLADPERKQVLLAGQVPLQVIRPDLKISQAHGRPFQQNGMIYFAVYSPAAAARNPVWEDELAADCDLFARVVKRGVDGLSEGPTSCLVCGIAEEEMELINFDDYGVPYCERCWS